MIYRPTGQIMWVVVDGASQNSIKLQIGADVFDLMAQLPVKKQKAKVPTLFFGGRFPYRAL
ncbi:hypothetical protein PH7735_03247 [Shimia thalassica]|uniref:Uncharacterized protein n=1 Tax=Shimia thalassica TaxID=1715693 RepID=A0A0P1IEL2_9RHOB|nr:hypothetical protein PH7735_03247 [Shimia thalassica]